MKKGDITTDPTDIMGKLGSTTRSNFMSINSATLILTWINSLNMNENIWTLVDYLRCSGQSHRGWFQQTWVQVPAAATS